MNNNSPKSMIATLVCLTLTLFTGIPGIHLVYIRRFKLLIYGIVLPTLIPIALATFAAGGAYYFSQLGAFKSFEAVDDFFRNGAWIFALGTGVSVVGWFIAWLVNIGTAILLVLEKLTDGDGQTIVWNPKPALTT